MVFAALLVILGQQELALSIALLKQFVFVFLTLYVFRILDDAASFHIDRQDKPSRLYVGREEFKYFLGLGSVIMIIYLSGLFLWNIKLALTLSVLVLGSIFLYLIFYRQRSIMRLIPLLKYPVIIYCVSGMTWSMPVGMIMAGSFLILLGIDFFSNDHSSWRHKTLHILLLLLTGFLILQPQHEQIYLGSDIVMICLPVILVLLFPLRKIQLLPVVLYPLFHLIDILI